MQITNDEKFRPGYYDVYKIATTATRMIITMMVIITIKKSSSGRLLQQNYGF